MVFVKNLTTKEDIENLKIAVKEEIVRLENEIKRIDNRIWWIVGIILVQWLSLMIAILFR